MTAAVSRPQVRQPVSARSLHVSRSSSATSPVEGHQTEDSSTHIVRRHPTARRLALHDMGMVCSRMVSLPTPDNLTSDIPRTTGRRSTAIYNLRREYTLLGTRRFCRDFSDRPPSRTRSREIFMYLHRALVDIMDQLGRLTKEDSSASHPRYLEQAGT
jgi:hypothetical protein